jgi:hypothetical protein
MAPAPEAAMATPAETTTAPTAAEFSAPVDAIRDSRLAGTASGEGEPVLFVTIAGDRTWYHWGHAGDRPPRIEDGVASPRPALSGQADAGADVAPAEVVAGNSGDYGGNDRPYGPPPQECPRTLPAGSSQAEADALRNSSGCRYLSSCVAETQECTWYYQGRG